MPNQAASRQRGAALLLAMVVLTLVATLAAGMVWQQSRAIHVEAAERARSQLGWMLSSGIDFAREVVRRFAGTNPKRGQPWDSPLQETRLSALLAADRDNSADSALEAFISGHITDAQSRYNLRRLINAKGELVKAEAQTLKRLCEAIGLPGTEQTLIDGLLKAWAPPGAERSPEATVALHRVDDLAWLNIDMTTLATLKKYVDILPSSDSPINLNTASREVIYAVIDGIDLATAGRLERPRELTGLGERFENIEEARAAVGLSPAIKTDAANVTVKPRFFYAFATMRFEDRAVTETALLESQGEGTGATVVLRRSERTPQQLQ